VLPAAANKPGLLLWSETPSRELAGLVELAEGLGYSELWYTDIRFQRDCYVGLALAAAHSDRILLGPGVSDPYSRHPALIAMAMATLDELSGGRVQLGLGTGGSGLAEMGVAKARPLTALREAIELIRAMLTGEPVAYRGELYQLSGAGLAFKPARPSIPIFIATHSPQTLALSGRLADGILLANLNRREAVEHATRIVRDAEAKAGREAGSVAVHLRLETCISDDEERAVAVLRRRFATRLTRSYPRWDYLEELGITASEAMTGAAAARDIAGVAATITDEHVRRTALVGSVESVVAQLQAVLTPQVARLTIRPMAIEGQEIAEIVTRFMQEVWPRLATEKSGQM